MELKRNIIEIDAERCDGCGQCVIACAEGAIEIINGKARLVKDSYCDGLGACLGECPQDALHMMERHAEAFDHEAVEEHLKRREKEQTEQKQTFTFTPGRCTSAQMHLLKERTPAVHHAAPGMHEGKSALGHWPVQIRLVPPHAPFLQGADLLVAADCAPVAYPNFHGDFLQGKVVMIGCPKFDNPQDYVAKFAEIFKKANIKSVKVVGMEVPCCSALPMIVHKGMELAQKNIPMEEVVIRITGEVLGRTNQAA